MKYDDLFTFAFDFCDAWDKELHCRDIYCEINCPLFCFLQCYYESKMFGKEIKGLVKNYIRRSIPHDEAQIYLEDLFRRIREEEKQ